MTRIAYPLALVLAAALSTGCKIRIESTDNGDIVSESGQNDCARGEICVVDVVDLFFDDTFTAMPVSGFVFGGWKKADRSLCGGSNKPCALSTAGFEGKPALEAFLAIDDAFTLSPSFYDPSSALLGDWQGKWENETFDHAGDITLEISPDASGRLNIAFDVDGEAFLEADPPPTRISLHLEGGRLNFSRIEFNGNEVTFRIQLNRDGTLDLDIPNLPAPTMDSFVATGVVTPERITLEYTLNFTLRTPAVGTVTIEKLQAAPSG